MNINHDCLENAASIHLRHPYIIFNLTWPRLDRISTKINKYVTDILEMTNISNFNRVKKQQQQQPPKKTPKQQQQ